VMSRAIKTQAVVSSLFPKSVQDRIMQDVEDQVDQEVNKRNSRKDQLKGFLDSEGKNSSDIGNALQNSNPIADLFVSVMDTISILHAAYPYLLLNRFDASLHPFIISQPEATIMFSDIVGFTAWSSTREPAQVFRLLETIYFNFDQIADRRRVFKVETVG
jgi:Adenylate and Guanylate cyclase catalytic domain